MIKIQGEKILVDEIVDKFSDMVYRLAFSRTKNNYDAQDITQEVFIKFINYDKDFQDMEHLKAFLIKVTINSSKNLLSSAWFRKTTMLDDNIQTYIYEESEVYKYVFDLPQKYRTVIHLFYFEGFKTYEIATILEVKEGTVRSQLSRARELLRNAMGREEFDVF